MPTVQRDRALLALALAFGAGGLALGLVRAPASETCRAEAAPMRRIELVFGLSRKGAPEIGEAEWRAFLDREITPRFPAGLTVLAGHGQWQSPSGASVSEPARLLLVWASPAPDLDRRIEAVRAAWKQAHRQESVLRAESTDCVAF